MVYGLPIAGVNAGVQFCWSTILDKSRFNASFASEDDAKDHVVLANHVCLVAQVFGNGHLEMKRMGPPIVRSFAPLDRVALFHLAIRRSAHAVSFAFANDDTACRKRQLASAG